MKLLIDMNLAPRWSDWLAGNGVEAVHWSSIGHGDARDADIMAYAKTNEWHMPRPMTS
jgi:predicted nuclease of predicted toxin-antitoxin system